MSDVDLPSDDDVFPNDGSCPVVLESPYRMEVPNTPVRLYSGPLEIHVDGTSIEGEGVIRKDWLPRSRVTFKVTDLRQSPFTLLGKLGHGELCIPSTNTRVKVLISQVGEGVSGVLNSRLKIGHGDQLRRLSFQLTNFEPVFGKHVRAKKGLHSWVGRMEWSTSKWRIRIDPILGSHELIKKVKEVGGFGITHMGEIACVDGSPFTAEDVEGLLQVIRHTLSFATGRWVAPFLIDGFDENGSVVYREWSNAIVTEWNPVQTWFSDLLGDSLQDVFKGFDACWSDPIWRDALSRAIWWYVASNQNTGGIDGSVMLVQVALELLAWVVYVERGKIISKKGFEDLPTADKLRLLLQWMQVPSDVPPELSRLIAFSVKKGCPIGPWVFTEIRNSLVHPKNRNLTEKSDGVLYEARQLGMWYLELSILYACQYRGKYLNRLKAKAVWDSEEVPWARVT